MFRKLIGYLHLIHLERGYIKSEILNLPILDNLYITVAIKLPIAKKKIEIKKNSSICISMI